MKPTANVRLATSDVQRSVIQTLAKMANHVMLEQRKPQQWAVNLLYSNVSDIATRLQCEQALAKFWI